MLCRAEGEEEHRSAESPSGSDLDDWVVHWWGEGVGRAVYTPGMVCSTVLKEPFTFQVVSDLQKNC